VSVAERALTTVVATCYLLGVSTRRMEKLIKTLGITRLSKSQVSTMAAELDAQDADFRTRPLDHGPYTFLRRGRAGAQCPRMAGGWSTCTPGWPPGVNGDGLAGVLPRSDRPRTVRGQAGHLRRAPRAGRRDRCDAARCLVAEMSNP
jgi:hypothetical protein